MLTLWVHILSMISTSPSLGESVTPPFGWSWSWGPQTNKLAKAPKPFSLGKFWPKTAWSFEENQFSPQLGSHGLMGSAVMIQNRKEEDPVDFENNYGKVILVLFWFHVRHFLQLNHFETKQNKTRAPKWMILLDILGLHEPLEEAMLMWFHHISPNLQWFSVAAEFSLPCWCFQRRLRSNKNLEPGKKLSPPKGVLEGKMNI